MRHPRIIIASISLAAAAAIGGGITAAAATGSPASSPPSASQQAAATVRTAQATVAGKTETILVSGQGQPLYYYVSDTPAKSLVTGGLAALWPPVTSASPAATGLNGTLAAVSDTHGHQVAYNGPPPGYPGLGAARAYSEHTQWLVDREVAALLTKAESRALDLLTSHREALTRLAAALLEQETVTGDHVRALAQAPNPAAADSRPASVRLGISGPAADHDGEQPSTKQISR